LCDTCASKLVPFLVEWVRIFLTLKVAKEMFADVILSVLTATMFRCWEMTLYILLWSDNSPVTLTFSV